MQNTSTLRPEHPKFDVFLGSPRGTEGALAVAQTHPTTRRSPNSPSGTETKVVG
jgi:hypothetical protein